MSMKKNAFLIELTKSVFRKSRLSFLYFDGFFAISKYKGFYETRISRCRKLTLQKHATLWKV